MFWSRSSADGNADAIIVLGAAQYAGRPSPVLSARLDHALELWQAGRAPRIVLTGGSRPGDQVSEAAAGRRYLVRRGVPAQFILLESAGRTSLASIQGAADLLHHFEDSLSKLSAGNISQNNSAERLHNQLPALASSHPRVLLVSDPFHMLRLDLLARLHGLAPMPSPTKTSPISANKAVIEYMVRESIAVPTDVFLLCWLKLTGRRLAEG